MSKKDPARFSPLFRIRKILLFLRLFLGFPLKPENKEFNEFVFQSCLEYTRYSVYLACFFLPAFYNMYSIMKLTDLNNPLEAIANFFMQLFGYTALDLVVVMTIPYTIVVSNTFYLRSFKKVALRFSQICLNLTNLSKELNESVDLMSTGKKKRTHMRISLKLFFAGFLITFMVLILWNIVYYMIIQDNLEELTNSHIADVQKYILMVNILVTSFCWAYPCITISADLIICEILEQTGEIYLHWNTILNDYNERFQPTSEQKLQNDMTKVKSEER
jgi:hypothetical protein